MPTGDDHAGADPLAIGQLRRHVALGTEAIYRVVELGSDNVRVEVVRAPGLTDGQSFEFTRDAVERMDLVDADPPA